jgi:NDP-sugar pyrophosphorylase family protein
VEAVILVGGLGTRLKPVLDDRPKPMAPVAGRPFLEYLVLQLRKHGIDEIVFAAGHGADVIERHFGVGKELRVSIRHMREEEPRGTGGALKLAEPLLRGPDFVALNGDSFFDVDLGALLGQHRRSGARATVALTRVKDASRFGRVDLGRDATIVGFAEKDPAGGPGLINAGVYTFQRDVLASIPADRPVSLERDVLPRLIGEGLYGVELPGWFIDIGIPGDYLRLRDDPGSLCRAVG